MSTTAMPAANHSTVMTDALRCRMTRRLARDLADKAWPCTDAEAAKGIDEMLVMLDEMNASGQQIAPPSMLADEAWHTFLIYSAHYARYNLERFGRIIHHEPDDDPTSMGECNGSPACYANDGPA